MKNGKNPTLVPLVNNPSPTGTTKTVLTPWDFLTNIPAMTATVIANLISALINNLPPTIANKHIVAIDPRLLSYDPSYQRNTDPRRVTIIAATWQDDLYTTILVSYRDGKLFVVDGWHRVLAAIMAGKTEIACELLFDYTSQQEAKRFTEQNLNRKNISPADDFKALCEAGNDIALQLKAILDQKEIMVARQSKTHTGPVLSGLTAALTSIKDPSLGEPYINWMVNTMDDGTWLAQKDALADRYIKGLRQVYREGQQRNCLDLYTDRVVKVMKQLPPGTKNFQSAAAACFPAMSDFRSYIPALFLAIAHDEVTIQNPVVVEYSVSNARPDDED